MSNYKTHHKDEEEFIAFIIHGHSEDWRIVERFINKTLGVESIVLKEVYRPGETIIEKLEDLIEQCHFAIAVLTPDDFTNDNRSLARQNVMFELGYCHSLFEGDCIILKEESVEINSDLHGLVYIEYKKGNIESTFSQLSEGIEEIFQNLEDEEDDDD